VRSAGELLRLFLAGVVPPLAYLAIGLWLLRALRLPARGAERAALAYVFGTGAASLGLLILYGVGWHVPLLALAVVAATAVPALRLKAPDGPEPQAPPEPPWIRWIDALTLGAGALLFLAALGPETYWDGFEYHLPIAKAWAEHGIHALPGVLDAELRAGINLLYGPALAAGQADAAAGVSAGFALALAALVRAETRRRASPGAASLAACFVLLAPFTLETAPSSYVDLGCGAYGFLALLFADRWNRTGESRLIPATALCLAFAANAKLHLVVLIPAVFVLVRLGGRPPSPRQLKGASALVLALAIPWCVKVGLTTGNPFFPFLGDLFGLGGYDPRHLSLRAFRLSTDFLVPRTPLGYVAYLASLAVGHNTHGSRLLGPLPFLLPLFAIQRLSRATALLLGVSIALALLQFVYMPALRFATPVLPFVAIAAAVGGARLARSGAAARNLLTIGLAGLALQQAVGLGRACLPRIAAWRDPHAYERSEFPDQAALREAVSHAEPVVAIPKGAVAWMSKPVYVLHWERNGELFFDRVVHYQTPPGLALGLLVSRGVHSLVLDVKPPLPADGSIGQALVDAWIRAGRARVRAEPHVLRARDGRVWVTIDLLAEPNASPSDADPTFKD
jgi:hypothetical protein